MEVAKRKQINIIIPVYNVKNYVKRCLDSVNLAVMRHRKDVDVLVIDDGSDDGSDVICKNLCNKYGFYYERIKHSGVSSARNRGIELANCEYIAFVDSDDTLVNLSVMIWLDAIKSNENIIQFNQFRHYVEINVTRLRYENQAGKYWYHNKPQMWCMVWNKIYRKEFLDANNIRFVEGLQFGEDEVFNLECLLKNEYLLHDKRATIVKHFDNIGSICHGIDVKKLNAQLEALAMLYSKYMKDDNIYGAYEVECLIYEHLHSGLYERTFRNERKA